jgi:deoxyribodipyrimidine photo-lyase
MATRKMQSERVQDLNKVDVREGDYVLYWMQSSQRAEQNHAVSILEDGCGRRLGAA